MSGREIINNLINITNGDVVYNMVSRRVTNYVLEHLDSGTARVASSLPQIPIIATDDYFIHYSVVPILRASNDSDQLLNKLIPILSKYMRSEDFRYIKKLTTLDDDLSLIHATKLTESLLREIGSELASSNPEVYESLKSGNLDKSVGEAVAKALDKVLSDQKAMERVFSEAREVTKSACNVRDLIGYSVGKEPGSFRKLLNLADKIQKVTNADQIITLSSNLISSLPRFTKVRKVSERHGEELRGYRLTRRVEDALPRELALPDEVFLYKLSSGGLLAREKVSTYEGSYYVLIDKSGSMIGIKTVWARSVALALYRLAMIKRRKYFLRFFDVNVYPDQPITDPYIVLDSILSIRSDGGTSIDHALSTALSDIRLGGFGKYTNTVIIITDGKDTVTTSPKDFKDAGASLVAVMIEGDNESLMDICVRTGGQYMKAELTESGALKLIDVLASRR